MKKVVVMANDQAGVEVCRILRRQGDRIVRLYLHENNELKMGAEIRKAAGCSPGRVFRERQLRNKAHVRALKEENPDFIITAYWGHLLKKEVLDCAGEGTVNFHPSLLPINRGWYPHVHNILDGSPAGVTLHHMDAGADTGPIWAQREVAVSVYDTAFTLRQKLQTEIIALFKKTWPKIRSGKITPYTQGTRNAVYHKKTEVDSLDQIDREKIMKAGDLINLLRARSFGNKGFAWYEADGKKVYVNIRLSKTNSFE